MTDGIRVRYSLIRDKNISNSQAALLSLLLDIDISMGIPSNKYLSNLMGTSKNAISNMLSRLKKAGYIKERKSYSDLEAYTELNKNNSSEGCLFCGVNHITLDEHHYPIRAKDNGVDTICLCPNCHRHFHELTDHNRIVVLSKEVEDAR